MTIYIVSLQVFCFRFWGILLSDKHRISGDIEDLGRYRRIAVIEGMVYTRLVKRKSKTFYFVYLVSAISVFDILKCS